MPEPVPAATRTDTGARASGWTSAPLVNPSASSRSTRVEPGVLAAGDRCDGDTPGSAPPQSGYGRLVTVARPPVVSQSDWDTALTSITQREETVAEAIHQLAAARKRMPMVRVEGDYRFEGPDGERSLAELFDGRSQLILYRFFFEEGVDGWPDAGCAGCSSWADGIGQLGLLHARDITFAMASPAPQANLHRYAERMGWTHIPWYTILTERFAADFGTEEWFGLNVFLRDGNDVYRTYFLQHGAMVQTIGSLWTLMSLAPYGGQADDEDAPEGWPKAPMSFWYRRHDEFDELPPSARS
jgi:predicted dithiol-disulfide oxidoreductase (DUF899 family)